MSLYTEVINLIESGDVYIERWRISSEQERVEFMLELAYEIGYSKAMKDAEAMINFDEAFK